MEKKKIEIKKYEITMYKLLTIIVIALFISIGLGFAMGNMVGRAQGINSVEVNAPNYCSVSQKGESVDVRCTELNLSAGELCSIVSTPLANKIKIIIVSE